MYTDSRRSSSTQLNIWPGFVDALSALLLVIIFVLLIFVVAQFYLSEVLTGKNKSLDSFKNTIEILNQRLKLLEHSKQELQYTLSKSLNSEKNLREKLGLLERNYLGINAQLDKEKEQNLDAEKEIALLNDQLKVFNEQLAKLNEALKLSEEKAENQKLQIDKMKLDAALVKKVQEMAKYRSEFFESLEKALGDRDDIRVEGDRFVFQSEVLFDTGSARLENEGIITIDKLAKSLKEIINTIPKNINWVLRIDGHTDKRPIHSRFKSNWELSFARAMAVVRRLIDQGIPANRLAATGFGANYPIDEAENEKAYRKNRRIEIKLNQR